VIAVVVLSYSLPSSIRRVVASLDAQGIEQSRVAILLTCGDSPAARARVGDLAPGVAVLAPSARTTVGAARRFACESLTADHVVFLDDDCVPYGTWWVALTTAVESNPRVSMLFGARLACGSGIGGRIREIEATSSRKYALLGEPDLVVPSPRTLVAGGNMCVRRTSYLRHDTNVDRYAGMAFEDVEVQLQMMENDAEVAFVRDMVVEHDDHLGAFALIRRSVRSGRGIHLCERLHPETYRTVTRWRVSPAVGPVSCWGAPVRVARFAFWLRATALWIGYRTANTDTAPPRTRGTDGPHTGHQQHEREEHHDRRNDLPVDPAGAPRRRPRGEAGVRVHS
jgi:GT2 family glycosyltransferase